MGLNEVFGWVLPFFVKGHLLILLVGLAPGLFWLWFFYRRDLEPEPIRLVATSYFVGALLCFPAIWAQLQASGFIRSVYPLMPQQTLGLIEMAVFAPISEEVLKFLATLLILRCLKEFDEPMDGIIYGVSVALGFATLENIGYLLKAHQAGAQALTGTAIIRAVLSVPGHALYACFWGYALGYAHFYKEGRVSPLYPLFGLALGIIAHSLFNLAAMISSVIGLALVVVVVILWGMAEPRIAKLPLRSPHRRLPQYRQRLRAMRSRLTPGIRAQTYWYDKKSTVLIMLFVVFAPAGLYGLVENSTIAPRMKFVYFIIWLGIAALAAVAYIK